jgi:hypothetical protein
VVAPVRGLPVAQEAAANATRRCAEEASRRREEGCGPQSPGGWGTGAASRRLAAGGRGRMRMPCRQAGGGEHLLAWFSFFSLLRSEMILVGVM